MANKKIVKLKDLKKVLDSMSKKELDQDLLIMDFMMEDEYNIDKIKKLSYDLYLVDDIPATKSSIIKDYGHFDGKEMLKSKNPYLKKGTFVIFIDN